MSDQLRTVAGVDGLAVLGLLSESIDQLRTVAGVDGLAEVGL